MRIAIYMAGTRSSITARAYDEDTDEHIWSSEEAGSPRIALQEIARAIEERQEAS